MASGGDDGSVGTELVGQQIDVAVAVQAPAVKSAYKPVVPKYESQGVPILGYNSSRGYPYPTIKPQYSVADAENRIIVVKKHMTSKHEFNYMQPNTVRYFATRTEDQNLVASAYITMLEKAGVYGTGKHIHYVISYDEDARSLVFAANDKQTAETLIDVAKQVQELVGGTLDDKLSLRKTGPVRYDTNVVEDLVDFKNALAPVKHKEVAGLTPAIIERLSALGVAPDEETMEGKSILEKLATKIKEWNKTGREDESAGIEIFSQHWAEMLALIAHVPEGPGGASLRNNRKETLTKQGYGPEAAELIMRGFPKPKFDELVKDVAANLETRRVIHRRHSGDIGTTNAKYIGEFAVPLIKDALDKDVYLSGASIVKGSEVEPKRPALDEAALSAAIREEVERTPPVKAKHF